MSTSSSKKPVHRLVIYRPKPGSFDALKAILLKHGPALQATGLVTAEPVKVWVASDLTRDGAPPAAYFVESFQWRDGEAADIAHQTPEVMAVWETMGPHVESMTLTTLEAVS